MSEDFIRYGKRIFLSIAIAILLANTPRSHAQTEDGASSSSSDEQKSALTRAKKDFADSHWADAFDEFKALHDQLPDNAQVTEFLSEAALNVGKLEYAHDLLDPLVKAAPNRWLAVALLTRYYAETKNDSARDAGLAEMQKMHDSGKHPKLSAMNTILLESHPTADGGTVRIWYSLKPWGRFNAYLYARYCDKDGHETSYMTLESSDMDQTLWAKSHATQAAAGERMFSLDFYRVPVKNANGSLTAFHATMGFFDGRPPYDQIRDRMIASGNSPQKALTSSTQNTKQP